MPNEIRNGGMPAYPLDQNQAHAVAAAATINHPGDATEREAAYIMAMGAVARGLTKRELFAAMVMQGFAADSEVTASSNHVAAMAVKWADDLLTELEKQP